MEFNLTVSPEMAWQVSASDTFDQASGKNTQRPQRETMLAFVREGDTVVVHSMDRRARNLGDLRRLVQQIARASVRKGLRPVPPKASVSLRIDVDEISSTC